MAFRRVALSLAVVGAVFGAGAAQAGVSSANVYPLMQAATLPDTIDPMISAGGPPDTPGARVDPNLRTSPFSGVVSINIRYGWNGNAYASSFICSGAAINRTTIVSAGHCIDTAPGGAPFRGVDVANPRAPVVGGDVRIVLNDGSSFSLFTAVSATASPGYLGFGNCPANVTVPNAFCLNHDISVIKLGRALPDWVQTYDIPTAPIAVGTELTLVGYGTSGDGVNGYNVSPSFFVKRSGKNVYDAYDTDDYANFALDSDKQVYYADFDGAGRNTFNGQPAFNFTNTATPGVLTSDAGLGNLIETNIGGGDSGGPGFIRCGTGYCLVTNNTFGAHDPNWPWPRGAFGDYFGGMLLSSYRQWIYDVPEPSPFALLAVAAGGLLLVRRRKSK